MSEDRHYWGEEASFAKCIDPVDATINTYLDGTYFEEKLELWFGFELCYNWIETNNCLDDDELVLWFNEHDIGFEQFYPRYSINWESKYDYLTEELGYFNSDVFSLEE